MSKQLSPAVVSNDWNFSLVVWRSTQLYLCSFGYTLLSVLSGTYTAFNARFYDADNTMWSSFRISDDAMRRAYKELQITSWCSWDYFKALYKYVELIILSFLTAFTMPDVLTKWLAASLFLLQLVCIFVSFAFINYTDSYYIITTMIVCGLNLFLVADIAILLMPILTSVFGSPIRIEYCFAILSFVIVVSLLYNGTFESETLRYLFHMNM